MEIREPVDVDSFGKLNEWLADCGMPEPETLPGGTDRGRPPVDDSKGWGIGARFRTEDREAATVVHKNLISAVAQNLYTWFSEVAADGRYLVWFRRPELIEREQFRYRLSNGQRVDLVGYTGDIGDLHQEPTGYSVLQFYCSFWLRDAP